MSTTRGAVPIVEFGSTSGWERARLSGPRPHDPQWDRTVIGVRFANSFWRRQPDTSRTIEKDALVEFPQVIVTRKGLEQLANALFMWEASLWPEADPYNLNAIDISTGTQSLTFAAGTTDKIRQLWQKVLEIAYKVPGSTSFVQQLILDTTILDQAINELRSFLHQSLHWRPT